MFRLALILYILVATVSAGMVVTALLSLRIDGASQLALGALAGAVVAAPIAWLVGKRVYTAFGNQA